MSGSVRPQRQQPTRLPRPWDSSGKNTGVGCHFLLQCMKVKSESEVAQSCPTLSDLMDCSLPGSSIHGIFQARVLEWAAIEIVQTFPKLLSLNVKCLSYREHVVGSCFYIQSYNFCPLIGKFNPFTFKIILILLDLPMPFCYVFWVAQLVKNPPAVTKTWVQSLGWEDPLEKGTASHSSILAWRIPRTVQSMGSRRVGHD